MTSGAKNRPKSKAVAARALELKASGKTRGEVQATLAAEGHKVSAGWISGLGSGLAHRPATSRQRASSPPSRPTPTPAPADASVGLPEALASIPTGSESADELRVILRRQVAALEELAVVAKAEGNVTAFANLARAVNATTAALAKFVVPPKPDPEDSPDMQNAAKAARERLHSLIDRALEESGGGE